MKRLNRIARIFLFTGVALSGPAFAQDAGGLTLESARDQAAKNNPELRKLELAADSAGWGKLEALSGHLPHVTLLGTHYLDAKYARLGVNFGGNAVTIPSGYPQTTFGAEASLNLFDGLETIHHIQAASLEHEASRLELSHARFRLDNLIQTRFNQALAAEELAKVATQNIETLEQHLKLAHASQRAGIA